MKPKRTIYDVMTEAQLRSWRANITAAMNAGNGVAIGENGFDHLPGIDRALEALERAKAGERRGGW